jgi:hypothetical protein
MHPLDPRVRWSAPAKAREGATMPEQPSDRTIAAEESIKPEASGEHYGHLTVEDDPDGTIDEEQLPSRHASHDKA